MRRALTLAALVLCAGCMTPTVQNRDSRQPALATRSIPIIEADGLRFRDLDRSGLLEPYEDWRLSSEERARDLVGRMNLAEKAGAMMHGTLPFPGGVLMGGTDYDFAATRPIILDRNVTSLITRLETEPAKLAEAHNKLQEIAEQGRLGIPLTLSTDPRNHFQYIGSAGISPTGFSQWPEAAGFAALADPAAVRRFADIARREYRAAGIHEALSPQADLATEPRWPRQIATFGADADLAAKLVGAYVEGFQHGTRGVGPDGVATIVKHWVGYGAAKQGWDSHFHYGRFSSFPGKNFGYHIKPFVPAFAARTAGVMPTYSILENLVWEGKAVEQVGSGFNRWLLDDLLRGHHGFDGVILSDWLITNDCPQACMSGSEPGQPPVIGMPWGVEQLSRRQRFVKGIEAGIDQFGGVDETHLLVEAVQAGELSEKRLEQSAYRVMLQKFRQGLFENPYVDPVRAGDLLGSKPFQNEADAVQRRALVLLQNEKKILPLTGATKVYLYNIAPEAARAQGLIPVATPEEADVAIVRTATPYELLHPRHFLGHLFHEGSLAFQTGQKDYDAIVRISARVPTIVTVFLDRPAILTALIGKTSALIGNFGVSDENLLAVVTGKARPEGRLPFELPSSPAEVEAQAEDLPNDTKNPLFASGYGLHY